MKDKRDFEQEGRERKVAKILAKVPLVSSEAEREQVALLLAKASPEWRKSLAASVGVREPSPESWAMLVDAVRNRPLATEAEISRAAHLRRTA